MLPFIFWFCLECDTYLSQLAMLRFRNSMLQFLSTSILIFKTFYWLIYLYQLTQITSSISLVNHIVLRMSKWKRDSWLSCPFLCFLKFFLLLALSFNLVQKEMTSAGLLLACYNFLLILSYLKGLFPWKEFDFEMTWSTCYCYLKLQGRYLILVLSICKMRDRLFITWDLFSNLTYCWDIYLFWIDV